MSKNATVSARIDKNVKDQAEDILRQLGIPVSVVINTLYHQIIARNGVPFSITLPTKPRSLDELTQSELDAKLQHSYEQALSRQGKPMDEVFDEIERRHT
ncbi:MAG: type II toxin-antitoxin system RelB/DinJ family antitoxin [Lachnospiraceae bacterium]|jgi:addiction module RelB/DinJ family antitoxin|nr:type II toxin-antitoxin system RelB/DinJ family antitoxin [Lachnospiraceae bacterium]